MDESQLIRWGKRADELVFELDGIRRGTGMPIADLIKIYRRHRDRECEDIDQLFAGSFEDDAEDPGLAEALAEAHQPVPDLPREQQTQYARVPVTGADGTRYFKHEPVSSVAERMPVAELMNVAGKKRTTIPKLAPDARPDAPKPKPRFFKNEPAKEELHPAHPDTYVQRNAQLQDEERKAVRSMKILDTSAIPRKRVASSVGKAKPTFKRMTKDDWKRFHAWNSKQRGGGGSRGAARPNFDQPYGATRSASHMFSTGLSLENDSAERRAEMREAAQTDRGTRPTRRY